MTAIPLLSSTITRYVKEMNGISSMIVEIITYENHVAQHLWFVLALFLLFCFSILFKDVNQRYFCVMGMILPIYILPLIKMFISIPDIPNYFFFEMPFFMLGRLICQDKRILTKTLNQNMSPFVFILLVTIYVNYFNESNILPLPLRWTLLFLTRAMGIFMVFSISALIVKISKVKNAFIFLDKKSYQIYLLHQPFIVSGGAGLLYAINVPVLVIILFISSIGVIAPLILDKIMDRSKTYKILILGGH